MCVPSELRDHFMDGWSDWVSPSELAGKLDVYCNTQNTTPSVKKTARLREYPSKSYTPKKSSLNGRFNRFNEAGCTSSFNRGDKLKSDGKSERPLVLCYGCGRGANLQKTRLSMSLADSHKLEVEVYATSVVNRLEGRAICTLLTALPYAKGNQTLLGDKDLALF
ncbi:hypothetical protein TNCV_146001 [Trichonephila clavipes]|nr:hypothetical protein TNCV_146001 [Trichonephila clavipes]